MAKICGADEWKEMQEFGVSQKDWLATFLELPAGIPSPDTFHRIIMRLRRFSTLEFKRELPRNDQIVKTIIGFSNQSGGRLVIGVADNRTIDGIPETEAAFAIEYLNRSI